MRNQWHKKMIIIWLISLLISRAGFVNADNDKEKARFYDQQSTIFYKKGDYDQALKYAEKAIKLDPTNVGYWIGISSVYFDKGMYDEAIQAKQKVLELAPEHCFVSEGLIHSGIAMAYAKKKEYDQAIKYYKIALKKSENEKLLSFRKSTQASLHSRLAEIYEARKEFEKANEMKKKAEELKKEADKISDTELLLRRLFLKDHPLEFFFGLFYEGVPLILPVILPVIVIFVLTGLIYRGRRRKKEKPNIDYAEIKWGIKEIGVIYFSLVILTVVILFILFFTVAVKVEMIGDITSVVFDILLISLIIYYVKGRYHQPLSCIGLKKERLTRNVGVGLAGVGGIIFLKSVVSGIILLLLWAFFGGEGNYVKFVDDMIKSFPEDSMKRWFSQTQSFHLLIFYFLLATVLGPLAEEMFYRGFVYLALRKIIGIRWAMVLSSLFFCVAHGGEAITPFLSGLVFVYLYERTKSLIPSIVAHSFLNATGVILVYFFPS